MKKGREKRGQIWVETVIYTLIGVVLLGMVLAFALPEIQKQKDKKIIEDSINAMNHLDNLIEEVKELGPGNKRKLDLAIRKGVLVFNSSDNRLNFKIEDSEYKASEIGSSVGLQGNLMLETEKDRGNYFIQIWREFNSVNITFNGENNVDELTKSSNSYSLIVENQGGDPVNINIDRFS